MSLLRFLMLLSLVVWIGGLIFFAFVLGPRSSPFFPRASWRAMWSTAALDSALDGDLLWRGVRSHLDDRLAP